MDITLASPYVPGSLIVTKNGDPVDPGDITLEDPDAGTFTLDGTAADDEIVVCYQRQSNDAPPADLAQDGEATHGTSSRVTRCDHRHEHGDLSASPGPHHSADQITGPGAAHAASHEDGGSDEIDVTGLAGAGSPSEILSIPTAETDDTLRLAPDGAGGVEWAAGGGGGAPDDATYLVGAAHAGLSAEIVVGATPGGELGNTWASPTVDASHSGSTHAATQAAAEATAAGADAAHVAAADPHAVYLKESDFDDIDFLVGTATGFTAAEIVVGTSPAGELGGTWASPTVDATHSGSSHAGLSGQPASTDVAVADGGTGSSTAAGARTNLGASASGQTRRVPIRLDTPDASGNGYPALSLNNGFSNVRRVVPAFTKDVIGTWEGAVRIPADYASGGVIVCSYVANATAGVFRSYVSTAVVAVSVTEDTAYTAETAADTTVPGTAKQRFDVSTTLTTTPVANSTLNVRVTHEGNHANDTLAVDGLLWEVHFEYVSN